jgi:hypothetical protein
MVDILGESDRRLQSGRAIQAIDNKELWSRVGIPTGNTASISLIVGYPATHFKGSVRRRFSHFNMIGCIFC